MVRSAVFQTASTGSNPVIQMFIEVGSIGVQCRNNIIYGCGSTHRCAILLSYCKVG